MQTKDLIATTDITINAPINEVWNALVDPAVIKQYMFNTTVVTDWKVGSPITWQGEWNGKSYVDKGVIRQVVPSQRLQYTHYSPLTGEPDLPENYHTITIELRSLGMQTQVILSQDNNDSFEDQRHSEKNWSMMLGEMKMVLEGK